MPHPNVLRIPEADKARLKVMFLAKHALSGGQLHPEDGNHAVYHHEILTTLQEIGLNVVPANSHAALFEKPDVDFVFILLNRAGFLNSEMLAPLLCVRHGIAYLGASPILRGLGDDKHLMKLAAQSRGVPVTPWAIVRRGQPVARPDFAWERIVVKPNASSASWGVGILDRWADVEAHAENLLAEGHDVIMEPYAPQFDVVVPVVGADGPWLLPTMHFTMPGQDGNFRSYEEKRALVNAPKEVLTRMDDAALSEQLAAYTRAMLPELWPFDYARFEFRFDPATRDVRFMEVNLSCNLWSKKTVSGAARTLGVSHAELVETIVCHSMRRQGLIG